MANLAGGAVSGNGSLRDCIRSAALTSVARQDELCGYSVGKTGALSRAHAEKSAGFCGFPAIGARTETPSHIEQYSSPTTPHPSKASLNQPTEGPGGSITAADYLLLSDALDIVAAARLAKVKHQADTWVGVTITWKKLSHPRQPWTFDQFIDRLVAWLREQWNRLGIYVWVRECGPVLGDHIHVLLAVPEGVDGGTVRQRLEAWFRKDGSLCLQFKNHNLVKAAVRVRDTTWEEWVRYVLKVAPTDYTGLRLATGLTPLPKARKPAGAVDGQRWGCARKVDKGAQAEWAEAQASTAAPICTTTTEVIDWSTGEVISEPTSTAALVIVRDLLGETVIPEEPVAAYHGGTMPEEIRAAVRLKLRNLGWTQDDLADLIGRSRCHLTNALEGRFGLDQEAADRLTAFLRDPVPPTPKRRAPAPRKARQHGNTAAPLFDLLAAA